MKKKTEIIWEFSQLSGFQMMLVKVANSLKNLKIFHFDVFHSGSHTTRKQKNNINVQKGGPKT